jgi:hypothetical protein
MKVTNLHVYAVDLMLGILDDGRNANIESPLNLCAGQHQSTANYAAGAIRITIEANTAGEPRRKAWLEGRTDPNLM